jgi:arylsulfatase A-like enzyme/Flp pilus assembly protein TadD
MRPRIQRPLGALLLLSLVLPGCRGGGEAEVPTGRPIVVVSIDTLRSDHLPAYGYEGVETPAIDALRGDAILFERAYSPVPLTLPAHASLLTGLLPPDHGVRDNAGYRLEEGAGTTVAEALAAEGYATGAAVSAYVMRAETGLARGFEHYDDELSGAAQATLAEIQRPGDETLDAALAWLDTVGERPFFLLFHIYEPHTPWEPPPALAARYGRTYDGEVAAADAVVGRLLAALRERGLYEDSTVILLSDHGEGLGDHGETEHGVLLYRESLQVPLLVKLPGARRAGATVPEPVQLTDVTPTLLELAAAPRPEGLDGVSLLALADPERPEPDTPRALYAETFHPHLRFGWSGLTSVILGRHHYVEGSDRELFDLVADPAERRNLLRQERAVYARLRDALQGFDPRLEPPFEEASETREALASLGYLGGAAPAAEGELPDPRHRIADLEPLRRAISWLQEGRNEEALPLLRGAAEAIPRSIDAWQFLGLALDRTGRPEEAYAAYQRAFELSNGSPLLAQPLGELALRLRRFEDAAAFLAAAVEAEPEELGVRLLHARALLFAGRPDDALAAARGAVELASESPDAHYLVGAIHMGKRELAPAEAGLRRALELAPAHPPALSDLAVLLASQGRRDEARALLERLVAAQPENRQAREMLARLGG